MQRKFVNDFEGGSYNGITKTVQIDCIGCQSVTLFNTSLAGSIILLPSNQELLPGQSISYSGKELETNVGKIEFQLTNFFANIDYGYALIKKRFTDEI